MNSNLDYKELASNFMIKNMDRLNPSIAVGITMYHYLKYVEGKTMTDYYPESKNYCYMLTDGKIGTLPTETINRITDEILKHATVKMAAKIVIQQNPITSEILN